MAKSNYRTTSLPSSHVPAGIPYIVGNEAAERFSFYGMKTILFVAMTQYVVASDGSGNRDVMTNDAAREWVHWFVASAYFFPIIGAIVSDAFLGKYRTIVSLSIVYCLGHLALAIELTRFWMFLGLTLIAIGTGAIKPCVSAHVGDQFGKLNQYLLGKVFGWFYFSINVGAFASTLLTPILLSRFGPHLAFGVPGILMLIATVVFWMGRRKFIHIPPAGFASVKEAFSGDGLRAMRNLVIIYVFVALFWSLFDQTGSAWIQQAKRMDRHWLGIEWMPSQIQAANPMLILLFIPLFSFVIYPAINGIFTLTPLRKIAIGFFVTVPAFAVPAWIESQITGGEVMIATSEADVEQWPIDNLFDGKIDGSGWVSAKVATVSRKFPQEIVIRLRERHAWDITSIKINPFSDLKEFLATQSNSDEASTRDEVESCWAKDVEVFVAQTRLGDRRTVEGEPRSDHQGNWEWTRRVGEISLEKKNALQTLEFCSVSAEYVLIRINSNWGGDYVSLGEIEVHSADPLPSGAHPHAVQAWPNVAATGFRPSIVWQLLAYVLMTAAEVMVSITCLEFSYTQAPNKMKSFIMSLYLLSVSAGNAFTALVNNFIQNQDGSSKLEGSHYYWFFTSVMLAAAFGFIGVAKKYRGRTYIQGQ